MSRKSKSASKRDRDRWDGKLKPANLQKRSAERRYTSDVGS
jgi:hypothetical protein